MAFLTTDDSFRLLKEGGFDFTNAIVTSSRTPHLDSDLLESLKATTRNHRYRCRPIGCPHSRSLS
jgi:hypothetical protein